jgi:F-type H+-transporting ATPase subunit delta
MRYTNRQYAKALYETLENADAGKTKDIISRFANVVVKHRKANNIKEIASSFEELVLAEKGLIRAKVTTASEMEQNSLIEKLKSNAEIERKIDPSLIAGAEITIGDTRISSSLKARLADLRKAMI